MMISELEKLKLHAESVGDLKEVADCCNSLGAIYSENGEYEEALDEHKAELSAAEAVGSQSAVALAHRRIGECLMNLGEFSQAEPHISVYLDISRSISDDYNAQLAYHVLGLVHLKWAESIDGANSSEGERAAHLSQSHEFFTKSYIVCKETRDLRGIKDRTSAVLLNLGMVKSLLKNYGTAFDSLREAMELAEASGNTDLLQRCYYELSEVSYHRHRFNDAELYAKRLLAVAVRRKSKEEQVDAYLNLFHAYVEQRKFKDALKAIRSAKYLKCTSHVEWKQVIACKKSAKVLLHCFEQLEGSAGKAVIQPQEKMKLFEKIGDLLAESLSASSLKHLELARENYEKMLETALQAGLTAASLHPCYVSLASTCQDLNSFDDALKYLEMQLECEEESPTEQAKTLHAIAVVSEKVRRAPSDVDSSYRSAAELAEILEDESLQALIYRDWKLYLQNETMVGAAHRDEVFRRAEELSRFLDERDSSVDSSGSDNEAAFSDDSSSAGSCVSDSVDVEAEKDEEWKCIRVRRQGYTVKKNPLGESELHVAAINNDIKAVRRLLRKRHPVDITDNAGWSPLHEASNKGFTGIVKELLGAGANVNFVGCDGVTPLMDAASNGHLDVMMLLLKGGAAVDARDEQKLTAADYLAEWEKSDGSCADKEHASLLRDVKKQLLVSSSSARKTPISSSAPVTENQVPKEAAFSGSSCPTVQDGASVKKVRTGQSRLANCIDAADIDQPGVGPRCYKEAIMAMGSRSKKRSLITSSSEGRSSRAKGGALVTEDEFDAAHNFLLDDSVVIFDTEENVASSAAETVHRSPNTSPNAHSSSIREELIGILEDSSFIEPVSASSSIDLFPSHDSSASRSRTHVSSAEGSQRRKRNSGYDSLDSGGSSAPSPIVRRLQIGGRSPSVDRSLIDLVWIKVTVDGWIVAVPIEHSQHSQSVQWLQDQVAARYFERHRRRPFLTLFTKGGAELSISDSLSLVIAEYPELTAKVHRWEAVSLEESYVQTCREQTTEVFSDIKKAMGKFETTNVVDFSDCLQEDALVSVLRALQMEFRINTLKLDGARFNETAGEQLGTALCHLSQLATLSLRACGVTAGVLDGIHRGVLSKGRSSLENVKALDLSFNLFGDSSSSSLLSLLAFFKNLNSLSLESADLAAESGALDDLLRFVSQIPLLQTLNLSKNRLGTEHVRLLLETFRSSQLKILDISHTCGVHGEGAASFPAAELSTEQLPALCWLNLSGCGVCDEHSLNHVLRLVNTVQTLSYLNLSNNRLFDSGVETVLRKTADHKNLASYVFTACNTSQLNSPHLLQAVEQKLKAAPQPVRYLRFSTAAGHCEQWTDMSALWRRHWKAAARIICVLNEVSFSVGEIIF